MSKAPRPPTALTAARLRSHSSQDDSGPSRAETARYIAEFTAELAFLARRSKLDLLAYLLDMARHEAITAGRTELQD